LKGTYKWSRPATLEKMSGRQRKWLSEMNVFDFKQQRQADAISLA
jgi:hypothetical protein